jgi:hypothetical protein
MLTKDIIYIFLNHAKKILKKNNEQKDDKSRRETMTFVKFNKMIV